MPDDNEIIERSREIRARAKHANAWAKAVRETSLAIREGLKHPRRPFSVPEDTADGTVLVGAEDA